MALLMEETWEAVQVAMRTKAESDAHHVRKKARDFGYRTELVRADLAMSLHFPKLEHEVAVSNRSAWSLGTLQ